MLGFVATFRYNLSMFLNNLICHYKRSCPADSSLEIITIYIEEVVGVQNGLLQTFLLQLVHNFATCGPNAILLIWGPQLAISMTRFL